MADDRGGGRGHEPGRDGSKLLCSVDSGNHALNGIYEIGAGGTGPTRLTDNRANRDQARRL